MLCDVMNFAGDWGRDTTGLLGVDGRPSLECAFRNGAAVRTRFLLSCDHIMHVQ